MKYRKLGKTGIEISALAMGGHEYLPNHLSRGFNEDFEKAITPGYIFPGFGGPRRKEILKKAFDLGINYFDVTHDSEKEALGRNFSELGVPYEVYVQTRPEGMCYTYDEFNMKMAKYDLLKAEAARILTSVSFAGHRNHGHNLCVGEVLRVRSHSYLKQSVVAVHSPYVIHDLFRNVPDV